MSRHGPALVAALAVALLAAAVVLPAGAQLRVDGASATAGLTVERQGGDGASIRLERLAPGRPQRATLLVRNTGGDIRGVRMSVRDVRDRPGRLGGLLSRALVVRVLGTGGAVLASRRLDETGTVDLGPLAAGRSTRVDVEVELPDGGAPPSADSGDNVYQGSRATFDLVFAAGRPDGATTPLLPEPRPEAPPAGGPWGPPRITTAASGLRSEPARSRAGSRRRCVSRRRFRIRLRTPGPRLVRRVRVSVGGRRVRVRLRRGRLTATIDLRGRVRGRIRVRIAVRLRTGRVLRGTRTYRLCVRRRPGGIPRL